MDVGSDILQVQVEFATVFPVPLSYPMILLTCSTL